MEGMKRASNVVSFLDWRNGVDYDCKQKKGEGEGLGSGLSLLSACGGESDCVDLDRFRDNGRWGSQIYEKQDNRSTPVVEVGKKEGSSSCNSSKEPMFEKAVTPSDVGKLNRLVIPKHHAEKYFPLDTSSNDKGLLLNFEDNTGKTWRFRYSYWNSSQSYVLTKGWSRFVKEKKLDAGDIVSFERSTDGNNAERLFISWKRRPCALQMQPGSKASLLRRLSLPASLAAAAAAAPTFQYGTLALPLPMSLPSPLQSQALFRAGSCSPKDWMSVVWPPNNGGAFWRLPHAEETSPRPLGHHVRFLPAREQNSVREPHDFMQLKVTGDRSSPVESARELSSKKGVRLFGVNL